MSGERGEHGDRGFQGERGKQGEHGQAGEKGDTGDIGPTGTSSPYLSRNRTLTLFVFIVLAFTLLAVRTESNTRRIQQGIYQVCIAKAQVDQIKSDCERFR